MFGLLLVAGLLPVAFGDAVVSGPPPQACEIAIQAENGVGVTTARILGAPGSQGTWTLDIDKDGTGGVSTVRQGGSYLIGPSGMETVARNEFDRHGRVHAAMQANGVRCEL